MTYVSIRYMIVILSDNFNCKKKFSSLYSVHITRWISVSNDELSSLQLSNRFKYTIFCAALEYVLSVSRNLLQSGIGECYPVVLM